MIQIDIEMPKCCDVCMFSQWSNLSQTASCKLKDYEPCFDDFSKEYKSKRASFCPLHEVSNNSPELVKENGELISRQAVLDAIFSEPLYESGMKKRDADIVVPTIYEKIKALPSSPSRPIGYWMRMSDLNELEDDRYKCSCCGNVVHHRDKVSLYTYNSWCGACGANNNAKNYAAYIQ